MSSENRATPPPPWSELQQELLAHILTFLQNDVDFLRCGLVCAAWRSAAIEARHKLSPFLCISRKHDPFSVSLFDLWTHDSQNIPMPETGQGRHWLCGSTHGWVIAVELDPPHRMRLLNPLSRTQIPLPPIDHGFNESVQDYVKKGAISSDPFDPDCVVLVIYETGLKLGFCRPGDEEWTAVESSAATPEMVYIDLMFYEGQFYATDKKGNILGCELGGSNPKVVLIAAPVDSYCSFTEKFLVGSSCGEFLLVVRISRYKVLFDEDNIDDDDDEYFKVFRLDLGTRKWSKVKSLGRDALFLGQNGSVCAKNGGNRIYFIDRSFWGRSEMVVYDLETKRSEKIYESATTGSVFWIVPEFMKLDC